MFAKLLESERRRNDGRRTLPGAMLSVALHAGAILWLVHPAPPPVQPLPIIVLDTALPRPGPIGPGDAASRSVEPPGPLPDFSLPIPEDVSAVIIPGEIMSATVPGPRPDLPGGAVRGSIFDRAGDADPGEVFVVALLDEPPVRLYSPPVDYPATLLRAGIEGVVLVEAVVDTVGRVEPESLRVVSADHPALEDAARRVVARSRFRPGRVHGRPVRVVVRLPVVFRL